MVLRHRGHFFLLGQHHLHDLQQTVENHKLREWIDHGSAAFEYRSCHVDLQKLQQDPQLSTRRYVVSRERIDR